MVEISFSPEAVSDLQRAKAYITNELCNEQAAVNTINKIMGRIRELAAFPEMGVSLSSIVDFETDYRFLSVATIRRFTVLKIRPCILSVFSMDGAILCVSCSENQTKTKLKAEKSSSEQGGVFYA